MQNVQDQLSLTSGLTEMGTTQDKVKEDLAFMASLDEMTPVDRLKSLHEYKTKLIEGHTEIDDVLKDELTTGHGNIGDGGGKRLDNDLAKAAQKQVDDQAANMQKTAEAI